MPIYTSISKQEAIAKFGHYFVLESSNNRWGYDIVEKLGQNHSIFGDDDDTMDFEEACGSLSAKVRITSHKTIANNDVKLNSFSYKWDLFFYRKGWINPQTSEKIYAFLVKDETARKNLVDEIPFKDLLKPLPDQFHLPTTCFEKDKVYYQFNHAHSVYQKSEVTEIIPDEIDVSVDDNNVISMSVSFTKKDGEKVNGSVSHQNFKKHETINDYAYFETGYTGVYVFIDKDECKKFAISQLNKDIEHFQKSIEELS